jgi:hypothetical protein
MSDDDIDLSTDPTALVLFHHEARWTLVWRDNGFLIDGDSEYEDLKARVAENLYTDLDQVERMDRDPWGRRD